MPRFFFDLHECGTLIEDEEGTELADLAAARDQAVHNARDVMASEVRAGRLCLRCVIHIKDADGAELEKVWFREALIVDS